MKKIIVNLLKLGLLAFVYTTVNALAFTLLPFSSDFKAQSLSQNTAPSAMVFSTITTIWTVGVICFIAIHSVGKHWLSRLLAVGSVFFVQSFMTQIETLFFGSTFSGLTRLDIGIIVLAGLLPILSVGILTLLLFQKPAGQQEALQINWPKFWKIASLNGLFYVAIYFFFGYFVAWQSSDLRLFYSGSIEQIGFIEKLVDNLHTTPFIYIFQWIRGVLFTMAVLPLLQVRWNHKNDYMVCVVFVFLCSAVVLVVPNFLFPDAVRWTHFIEMFSSMLLFGILTAAITKKCLRM